MKSQGLMSLIITFLVSCQSANRQQEAKFVHQTHQELQWLGRAIRDFRLLEGALPGEAHVWDELWSRKLITADTPYVNLLEDPHGLLIVDAWGKPLEYRKRGLGVEVASAGSDGCFGNDDDLLIGVDP